ncbi:MAG: OmpH family outer membrane protein [Acidobacteria bacterium]|nr:OmpH family outer membrane protein [Acidobacteriota bacterium]
MKQLFFFAPALALGVLAAYGQAAPAQTKVGIIHIQNAIIGTKEGQKAAQELQVRFAPKKTELEKKQNDIESLRAQLAKGANAMGNDQKEKLMRDIDLKTKSLTRDTEDAQAELDQEQQKVMNELGGKLMAVIDKYARDNGYAMIFDISSQQSPVIYAANGIDITPEVVSLYDKNAPAPAAVTAAPAPRPAAPVARPATPAAPPVVKKK